MFTYYLRVQIQYDTLDTLPGNVGKCINTFHLDETSPISKKSAVSA